MIIVLLGKMATGKDTVINIIRNKITNMPTLISHTTRPKRRGEINGKDYYFVDNKTFESMIERGEFIEFRSYRPANGDLWYYGLTKKEISDNALSIVILDPIGYEALTSYFGKENVIGILLEANEETIYNRAVSRNGDSIEEINRRIEDDNIRFDKFKKKHLECHRVFNNNGRDINDVVDEIMKIIYKSL